jgi:hypothetical protein
MRVLTLYYTKLTFHSSYSNFLNFRRILLYP